MAEDEVTIHGSSLRTVERCKERLLHLFEVVIRTTGLQDHDESCKIRLCATGANPSESVKKAKVYLEAVVGSDPLIVCETISLPREQLNMVHCKRDEIEKLFQGHLEFCSKEVRIQGQPNQIDLIKDAIEDILSEYREQDSISSLSVSCGDIQSLTETFIDGVPMSPVVQDCSRSDEAFINNAVESPQSQELVSRGAVSRTPKVAEVRLGEGEGRVDYSPHSDSSSSRSSSPGSELDRNEQKKDDYEAKRERAMKLGYTEEQLLQALRRLGMNADENQVLSEMIKIGSSTKNSQEVLKAPEEMTDSLEEDEEVYLRRKEVVDDSSNLRPIVIDGSNVAMSHGKDVFSCLGIKLAVDWFKERGHKEITVFVPQWRKESSRPDAPISDQEILLQLERENILSFTPARRVAGRRMVCYDDRYVLKLAAEIDGIVVSNDNYRDLVNEKPEFKKVVEERLLMYTFASNRFMPPDDPLGRRGPTLDNFLRKEPTIPEPLPQECPYGKKCTYGSKCRFYHPERKNQPYVLVTDKLKANMAKIKTQEAIAKQSEGLDKKKMKDSQKKIPKKQALSRTQSVLPPGMADEMMPASIKIAGSDMAELAKPDKQDYNDKLSQHRQKFEKALEMVETSRKADESERLPPPGHPTGGYLSGSGTQDNQLHVPQSTKETLVSGHLLLAKKLSDEDTKFFRNEGDAEYPRSNQRYASSGRQDSGYHEQMPKPPDRSGLSPHHLQYDHSLTCHSGPIMGRYDPLSRVDVGEKYPSYPQMMPKKPAHYGYGGLPDEGYEHPAVNRIPSAPDPGLQAKMSVEAKFHRQNSFSDPQLHMMGADGALLSKAALLQSCEKSSGHPYHQLPRTAYTRSASVHQSVYEQPYQQGLHRQTSEVGYPHTPTNMNPYWHDPSSMRPWQPPTPQERVAPAGQESRLMSGSYRSWPQHAQSSFPLSPVPHPQQVLTMPHPGMPSMPLQHSHPPQGHLPVQMSGVPSQPVHYANVGPYVHEAINTNDPRYGLYYNLCGLFDKHKVADVMRKYPEEMNPLALIEHITKP